MVHWNAFVAIFLPTVLADEDQQIEFALKYEGLVTISKKVTWYYRGR